jgi:hypothetical protein
MAIPLELPVFDPVKGYGEALRYVEGLTVGREMEPYTDGEIKSMSGQKDIIEAKNALRSDNTN